MKLMRVCRNDDGSTASVRDRRSQLSWNFATQIDTCHMAGHTEDRVEVYCMIRLELDENFQQR